MGIPQNDREVIGRCPHFGCGDESAMKHCHRRRTCTVRPGIQKYETEGTWTAQEGGQDMVPRKKTLAKTAAKKSVSTEEKKVPSVVEKKETAVAEVVKKETAVASIPKKETALAHVEKKETAVAPVQKKETALAHVKKKETAVAPVQKKETALAHVEKKETAVAAVEKKETAVTVKKTTAKRTTKTTTTAAKKEAVKKEVKTAAYVQYAGSEVSIEKLEAEAKKAYAALGHKEEEIETLTLYVKPEEHTVYYVVNGEGSSEYKIVY